MRRRTELYIEGHRVDLDDDALVLLNYATADLYNPAVIRNSYSREIRIPGTQVNDDIFGSFFRVDRRLSAAAEPPQRRGLRSSTITWSGNGDVSVSGTGQALVLGSFIYNTDHPDESVTIDGTFRPSVNVITNSGAAYVLGRRVADTYGYGTVLFVQAVGYDTLGNKVAASPSYVLRWWPSLTAAALQTFTGYTPDPLNTTLVAVDDSAVDWTGVGEGSQHTEYRRDDELAISLTAVGLKRVDIVLTGYNFQTNNGNISAYHEGEAPSFYQKGTTVYVEAKSIAINDATPGGEPDPPEPPDPPIPPDPPAPASGNYRTAFDPSVRADFSIYADGGNLLMTGYAKLTDVVETGAVHTYALSLYGGLGSFLYNLSQRDDGQRMTLADLDYGGGDYELDFDITKEAVADAWARLGGDTSKPEMWDIINFAPAYNGIPDGEFYPDKALVDPTDIGFPDSVTIDNVTYNVRDGYALLNYPVDADEWAAKDLRSYLQRPVVSVWRIMQACADPQNNGGWSVDLSDLESDWPYKDVWLTRPLLPSLGTYRQTSGDSVVTFDSTTIGQRVGAFTIAGTPAGMQTSVRMEFTPVLALSGMTAARLYTYAAGQEPNYTFGLLTFIQPVAYDSGGNAIAYGDVVTQCHNTNIPAETLAAYVHFTPQGGAAFRPTQQDGDYDLVTMGVYMSDRAVTCEVAGADIASVRIMQTAYMVGWYDYTNVLVSSTGDGTDPCASLFANPFDSASMVPANNATTAAGKGTATWASPSTLRSGAHLTKQMLLSTSKTPAEYLVGLCKTFGLYIVTDPTRKAVAIMRRASFYAPGAADVIDLTHRDDKTHDITLLALTYDARWYDFKHEIVEGAFAKEYAEAEGVEYGIQRVDTGYQFDAEAKDLLAGSVLRSCAAVRDRSPYWYRHTGAAGFLPSPLAVPPGGSYALWDASGNALDTPINPGAVTSDPYSLGQPGYDPAVSRAEFRDAENKPVDGEDVLLFGPKEALLDWHTLEDFNLTDDLPAMDSILGQPCWVAATNPTGLRVPVFTRLKSAVIFGERVVTLSLDFGVPRQVAIPDITYKGGTIYEQAWREFIHDRLDRDNKVLRMRVHLDGIQVGPDLLRRFWWWRGSLWVLNSIQYSCTTFDTAECEFVQVRDIANYITQY